MPALGLAASEVTRNGSKLALPCPVLRPGGGRCDARWQPTGSRGTFNRRCRLWKVEKVSEEHVNRRRTMSSRSVGRKLAHPGLYDYRITSSVGQMLVFAAVLRKG
jgi:hypothetical protein